MAKWVYMFREGNADMRNLLGGKGANLAEMTNLGLPIPQGFTVTTEACTNYYENGEQVSDEIRQQIFAALGKLEQLQGKTFGDVGDPLLVSVRSGARASMPGMMDTILNLGLNDEAVEGFARKTGNPRFALRFLPPVHPDVFGRGDGGAEILLREDHRRGQGGKRRPLRYGTDGGGPEGAGRQVQSGLQRGDGRGGVPAGAARAADGRGAGGVPLLGQPACDRVPPDERHPGDWGPR